MSKTTSKLGLARYLGSVFLTAVVTTVCAPLQAQMNSTTVALVFLLHVLFIALLWGSRPALLASILAVLSFNFFFLPPLYTFSIENSENWVALAAFFTTALAVGQLSARARKRAEEAESGKREIERLYRELREAFVRASRAEAFRQSEKLKSTLLDAVTHDLRTPLASIKASVTTLLDEATTREAKEYPITLDDESRLEMLEVINEETDRLNRFITGLIEMAKIEAGEMHLRRSWGSVDDMISNALDRARPLTKDHPITVEIESELPVIRVDERAVSEVLYSLIDNAAKYSPQAAPIRITARRDDDAMTRFTVEDRGSGIPPELRQRVFDKFFRATSEIDSRTQRSTGTGMGLAIAKGIVDAHDGEIWIESGAGNEGTRVVFTLPVDDEEVAAELNELPTASTGNV